ncbi:hypothetical protein AALP_AA8G516500 [Arabis alpina]|uniref:Uncharacterized protein n=1 Tax=Arabis alpina TaxID=50452 RepID=A0A087GF03_ARAAL|nr:hypothetical protein AALP_AA8G516500 [Arabis alpina]
MPILLGHLLLQNMLTSILVTRCKHNLNNLCRVPTNSN